MKKDMDPPTIRYAAAMLHRNPRPAWKGQIAKMPAGTPLCVSLRIVGVVVMAREERWPQKGTKGAKNEGARFCAFCAFLRPILSKGIWTTDVADYADGR